eukprot:Skav210994  [mRNA]  locus=scaffold2325:85714:88814:+ [translate_table: standard]
MLVVTRGCQVGLDVLLAGEGTEEELLRAWRIERTFAWHPVELVLEFHVHKEVHAQCRERKRWGGAAGSFVGSFVLRAESDDEEEIEIQSPGKMPGDTFEELEFLQRVTAVPPPPLAPGPSPEQAPPRAWRCARKNLCMGAEEAVVQWLAMVIPQRCIGEQVQERLVHPLFWVFDDIPTILKYAGHILDNAYDWMPGALLYLDIVAEATRTFWKVFW